MYSLIMGAEAETRMSVDRAFEYTDSEVGQFFSIAAPVGRPRLVSLPALVLPELQSSDPAAVARVGFIENLRLVGVDEWRYRFVPNPSFASIPLALIKEHAAELQIDRYEGNRTHWAIKPVELYGALSAMGATAPIAPKVFQLPTHTPRDPDLLAVMMPFAGTGAVYDTLKAAASEVGMTCIRADDMWEKEQILDDILSLIWRAEVVVADFTGRNPNVFYEVGIAHTIGRSLIPITQSMDDVPFDLRQVRVQAYLNNAEGLDALRAKLVTRLSTLRAKA